MDESPAETIETLKQRIAKVLDLAVAEGASSASASASRSSGLSVTVRMREVETLEYHRDQGLGITVYFGQCKGSASTSDLSDAAIAETVRRACGLAQYSAEDVCAGLADPERLARDVPDLDLHHPWALEPAAAIDLATTCEAAALDADKRIQNSEGASVSTSTGCRAYGNTHSFLEGYCDSSHSLACAVIAGDGSQMERDFEYTVARDPAELVSAEHIGSQAADRSLRRLDARKLDTRKVPVLYAPRMARGLFGHLVSAISGGSLYRKSTFLPDSVDSKIFADFVSVDERPHLPRALASSPYDNEGVATQDRRLVDAGVLKGYVLGSYYARKLGLETTGNAGGTHNLIVSDTGQEFAELLTLMDRGFLLTELMGHGINPVTGDYSRGAAGFWVEGGQIQFPVNEMTIAGNLKDMFENIIAIGRDRDLRSGIQCGSVLVSEMTLAGN